MKEQMFMKYENNLIKDSSEMVEQFLKTNKFKSWRLFIDETGEP